MAISVAGRAEVRVIEPCDPGVVGSKDKKTEQKWPLRSAELLRSDNLVLVRQVSELKNQSWATGAEGIEETQGNSCVYKV